MARCGCGGAQCGCTVIAGDNATIAGTGSAANPYIITAVTDCTEVRACLHDGQGVAYVPGTGTFSAELSPQAGNNIVFAADGGLYVPAGAATVSTGCGLGGDGAASAPLHVNTVTWPYACPVDTRAGGVYCDASGTLRSDPPKQLGFFTAGANVAFANVLVPTALTTVVTNTTAIVNPDPCRAATVIVNVEADASFMLPAGAGGAFAINGDEMWYVRNEGTAADNNIHAQLAKTFQLTVPAGGTVNQVSTVGMTRGSAAARYNRVQWAIRAWLFT